MEIVGRKDQGYIDRRGERPYVDGRGRTGEKACENLYCLL